MHRHKIIFYEELNIYVQQIHNKINASKIYSPVGNLAERAKKARLTIYLIRCCDRLDAVETIVCFHFHCRKFSACNATYDHHIQNMPKFSIYCTTAIYFNFCQVRYPIVCY